MTKETGMHQPTEEFRSALEWEVSQALRRDVKAATVAASNRRRRFLFTGSLAATLAIGVVIGAAPAQIQDARQRDSLTSAAQRELEIASARLQYATETYRIAEVKAQLGMLTSSALAAADAGLTAAQSAVASIRLNLEEIQAASIPPRTDLSAPLVGQRDFVTERLQVELTAALGALARAETNLTLAERRVQTGMVVQSDVDDHRLHVARRKAEVEILMGRLDLRKRVLQERLAPTEVTRREQLIEVRQELVVAQQLLAIAAERLTLVKTQEKLGTVDRAAVLKAELEVLQLSSDVQLLATKMVELSRGGRGGDG